MTLKFNGHKSPVRREMVEKQLGSGWIALMKPYRKTTPTYAVQIGEPFEVDTLEGLHTGKAGDWLAVGPHGEMYPIDAAVFADSYEEAT